MIPKNQAHFVGANLFAYGRLKPPLHITKKIKLVPAISLVISEIATFLMLNLLVKRKVCIEMVSNGRNLQ